MDIAHLDFSKAFDTVSLSAEQMERGVNKKMENRLKGMGSGTKSKWSLFLSNILINDVDDEQSIPTADRDLGVMAGVLGGCAAIQGSLGRWQEPPGAQEGGVQSPVDLGRKRHQYLLGTGKQLGRKGPGRPPGLVRAKRTPVAKKVKIS